MTRPLPPVGVPPQDVRFGRSADGTRLAYAVHGAGPPLLLASCWLSHLEFDWQSPVWRHFLLDLGRFATVIRYDERGYGMSDREVDDFELPRQVEDPQAVELEHTFQQMIKVGWARPDSTFRRVFTNLMIPGASAEQAGWLDALQARATSTENAVRARAGRMQADVRDLLPGLTVPTLVLHARGDRMIDFSLGRELAARIPGA